MWTGKFWKLASERAIRAFAAALISLIGSDAVNIVSVGNMGKVYTALGAAIMSLLFSVTVSRVGDTSDPSLVETK